MAGTATGLGHHTIANEAGHVSNDFHSLALAATKAMFPSDEVCSAHARMIPQRQLHAREFAPLLLVTS